MSDTKQDVEITENEKKAPVEGPAHTKDVARKLAKSGSDDGDAYVDFGRGVSLDRKAGWSLISIYKVTLIEGCHDFNDANALRAPMAAYAFSELAAARYGMNCGGIRRSFYAPLSALAHRKGDKALSPETMKTAIDDSRKMSVREFRDTYFPKTITTQPASVTIPATVDEKDCFELAGSDDCATLAAIIARVRELAQLAITYGGENGLNSVLNCVVAVNDEHFGADVCTESEVCAMEESAVSAVA